MTPYATYDQESDAIYVHLNDGIVARTVSLDDLRMVDYSEDDTVLGIEFLDVSDGIDLGGIPEVSTVGRLIGETGFHARILA